MYVYAAVAGALLAVAGAGTPPAPSGCAPASAPPLLPVGTLPVVIASISFTPDGFLAIRGLDRLEPEPLPPPEPACFGGLFNLFNNVPATAPPANPLILDSVLP